MYQWNIKLYFKHAKIFPKLKIVQGVEDSEIIQFKIISLKKEEERKFMKMEISMKVNGLMG